MKCRATKVLNKKRKHEPLVFMPQEHFLQTQLHVKGPHTVSLNEVCDQSSIYYVRLLHESSGKEDGKACDWLM